MSHSKSEDTSVERFVKAQERAYGYALDEIRAGQKRSHWIWYIFPQVRGLGYSDTAWYYGISSAEELAAYIAHPVLMPRLREITQALLALSETDPVRVLGGIDALKVRSCMTLFGDATGEQLFTDVLAKYYGGEADERTREIVTEWKS